MVRQPPLLHFRRFQGSSAPRENSATTRASRSEACDVRKPFVLFGDEPKFFPNCREAIRGGWTHKYGVRRLETGGDRKALRARFSYRRSLEPRYWRSASRKPDLSHRSLPRQRDRSEHSCVPIRQWNLRAGVEPPLCG